MRLKPGKAWSGRPELCLAVSVQCGRFPEIAATCRNGTGQFPCLRVARHAVPMSGDDELDRLLREVDSSLSGTPSGAGKTPPLPTKPASGEAAEHPGESRGRVARSARTGLVAGAVSGGLVFAGTALLSWLPLIDNPLSSGMGAFVGGFLVGGYFRFRER